MRKEVSRPEPVRRSRSRKGGAPVLLSPGLLDSPVLDQLCTHFVLTLTLRQAGRFAGRRDWNSLLSLTARHLVWPVSVLQRLREFLGRRVRDHEAWSGHAQLDDAAFLERHGWWGGPYEEGTLYFYLDEYIKDAPKDLMAILGTTGDWLAQHLRQNDTLVEKNVELLAGLLQLNPAERALILYGTLARYQRDLRGLLVEFKVASAQEAYATLAEVAGVDQRDVAEALRAGSRLERIGMIENLISEHNITDLADLMKVSDQLPPVLMREYRDPQDLMAVFTRPSVKSELTAADFHFVADEVEVLTALLRNVVALLFDEVEDVFPPISSDAAQLIARLESSGDGGASGSVNGKAWVNQILESNPVPVIWVTNRIEQIDPAFRRRFQYHLELKSPPPGAREALVRRALGPAEVSAEFIERLTQRKALTPAQIRTAVRFARLVGETTPGDATALERLIERQIAHADLALGNTDATRPAARPAVTGYDLALLNVESRFEVPRIVEALRRRGHGALCFHGAPGTGKTALAEHIAQALGRPLMIRQASDLVSKFVGETEQNMARMFAEAGAEQAVLLLDEADSFLRTRRRAERSYEVTEVNEMLQGMERFGGVFICTTNLFEDLDEAALRRFTFKIRFLPLRAEQRERMFVAEALGGAAERLSDEQRRRLALLDQLACGDFAAVRRQVDILGEAFEPDEFLAQLESEHRVKPQVRERRSIGFTH